MAPKRSSNRKRQTTLAFSPVPASSSAATTLSPHVRDRAAAVTLNGSPSRPSKKRKLDFGIVRGTRDLTDSDDEVLYNGLPTPKKSFRAEPDSEQRKTMEEGSMREGMPAQRNGMFGSSDNEQGLSSSESSEDPDGQRQPYKKTAKSGRANRTRKQAAQSKSESEEVPVSRKTRSSKRQRSVDSVDSVLGRQSESSEPPQHESESSDSDEMPNTTPPRRRRPPARRQRSNSFEVADDVVQIESESSDEEAVTRGTQKRRPVQLVSEDEEEDEDSEEEAPRSSARRLIRKAPQHNRDEEDDLREDLDFLQSSPPPDKGRLRSTNTKPLNERQRALEALKKRRASTTGEPSSSATSGRRATVVVESDSDELEIIDEDEDEDEEQGGGYQDEESDDSIEDDDLIRSPGHKAQEVFYENENDADFIDDNDDTLIGEPAAAIPLEFSSLSRAKAKDLFKYAVEWMVQKKINPAFSSTDDIYNLTFRKLNDEVNGLANSKFSSAAWTADFTRAIRARPEIFIDEISPAVRAVMSPHCEACNRKTHPATFNISLTGNPYNKESLEPLVDDSDSSESDSGSSISSSGSRTNNDGVKATYDAQGERLPPEDKVFTLGSTCKANAQMAHTLHHWRYHLNSWVVDYLARNGHTTPEKLVQRDSWSVRKREKAANKIVDEMERCGEIRKLYRLYKEQVDFAVEARNEYKSGWGRRR